jgi:CheY-like chemotaxis protein
MEVSRITRGKIELRKELVDVADIVNSAVETSKPLIEAAQHELSIHLPAEPLLLDGDPVRLAQVFANLLNNAAKYTPNGGRIALMARREAGNAVAVVADNGIGIPPDRLGEVFDLFMQAEHTYDRAQGGLGIGLTLVRSIVTLHGGSVEAKSAGVGRGSEFVVQLPLAESSLTVPRASMLPDSDAFIAPRRILVVDDNADSALSLSLLLRCLGADVFTANDGTAALEAFRAYQPSIAVLDIGMPQMDGYEVARRLRREPGGADITLIALTGWGYEEDRRRSKAAGIDHHLIKPVELSVLQPLLDALPAKRHAQAERTRGTRSSLAVARTKRDL